MMRYTSAIMVHTLQKRRKFADAGAQVQKVQLLTTYAMRPRTTMASTPCAMRNGRENAKAIGEEYI